MTSSIPHPTSAPRPEHNAVVTVLSDDDLTPFEISEFKRQHRLGLPLLSRSILGGTSAFLVGSILGISHGARKEGLRFRAENAHRLPTSQRGWYFYHKSKNYVAALGGVKEGLKMGARTTLWVAGFIYLEAAADHYRGYGEHQDFLSTTCAGLATAGVFSAVHKFPAATTVRTGKLGLKIGLGLGLLQDLLGVMRGRKLSYVEYGKRLLSGRAKADV